MYYISFFYSYLFLSPFRISTHPSRLPDCMCIFVYFLCFLIYVTIYNSIVFFLKWHKIAFICLPSIECSFFIIHPRSCIISFLHHFLSSSYPLICVWCFLVYYIFSVFLSYWLHCISFHYSWCIDICIFIFSKKEI